MKTKSILVLSAVIVVMTGIIVAGVVYLYSDLDHADKVSQAVVSPEPEQVPVFQPVQEKPVQEQPATEAEETQAGKSEAEPESLKIVAEYSVQNCKSGKQNTLVQKSDNSIELIDHTGNSLWTMALNDKIAETVAQVDYFKNNKIQFLFAEGKNLHLIDRLGREVVGFPVALPAESRKGPEKVVASGKTFWAVKAGRHTVYADLNNTKKTSILNELPK